MKIKNCVTGEYSSTGVEGNKKKSGLDGGKETVYDAFRKCYVNPPTLPKEIRDNLDEPCYFKMKVRFFGGCTFTDTDTRPLFKIIEDDEILNKFWNRSNPRIHRGVTTMRLNGFKKGSTFKCAIRCTEDKNIHYKGYAEFMKEGTFNLLNLNKLTTTSWEGLKREYHYTVEIH